MATQVLLSTTGTQGIVTIPDLNGVKFVHPLVDFDLLTNFSIFSINRSSDLASAITAGYVTIKDENSVNIPDTEVDNISESVPQGPLIVGATKTKITYNAYGLVISGGDATTADINDSLDRRYVTDAQLALITSGSGTVTSISVASANGLGGSVATPTTTPVLTLTTSISGMVKADGTAFSAAVAGTDYVAPNAVITGATNTKITYDAKGLVTSGTAATTADINDSTNRRYVTDAQLTVLGNTSNSNSGDNAPNSLYSGLVSNATHTGDATGATVLTLATVNSNIGSFGTATSVAQATVNAKGLITAISNVAIQITESQVTNLTSDLSGKQATLVSGTNIKTINSTSLLGSGDIAITGNATHTGDATGATALTVVKINGTLMSGLATGILKNTTGTGVPSIAVAGDFPTLNQNTTGNAATVTTNANLTGPITSVGNATSIASQTGTGTTFAMSNSPTFTGTPTLPTGTIATTQAANDNSTKIATTAYVDRVAGATASFTSADQTITSAGILTIAHGLGALPKQMRYYLICQTANNNYSVNDVLAPVGGHQRDDQGMAVVVNATNIVVRFGAAAGVFAIVNKTTGVSADIVNANWKVRLYAAKEL